MSLSDEVRRTIDHRNKQLLLTLERTRECLALSKEEWASRFLRMTERQYSKVLSRNQSIPVEALFLAADKLFLNVADFGRGEIDFEALRERERGNRFFVSPRYTVAANSRKHTVLNALDYIEKFRGRHLREAINRRFLIHEEFWKSGIDDPINIRFVADLYGFLRQSGIREEGFRAIGQHSTAALVKTPIAMGFALCESVAEVNETMVGSVMPRFEENCRYRITRLTSEQTVVESRSNPAVAAALGLKHLGSFECCQVRAGIMSGMPHFIGLPPASVQETRCVHRGDSCCRFVVSYSSTKKPIHDGRTRFAS